MNRIVVHSRVGADGVLRLNVPIGAAAADDEVEVLVNDALNRLRQALPEKGASADRRIKRAKFAKKQKKPLTKEEFHRHLAEISLMSELPDRDADFDDPDEQLIDVQGEPLSETVISERRSHSVQSALGVPRAIADRRRNRQRPPLLKTRPITRRPLPIRHRPKALGQRRPHPKEL